jgi:hypothetical protein
VKQKIGKGIKAGSQKDSEIDLTRRPFVWPFPERKRTPGGAAHHKRKANRRSARKR